MRRTSGLRRRCAVVMVAAVVAAGSLLFAAPASAATPHGYLLVGGDGGVFAFGSPFLGTAASNPQNCPPNTVDRGFPNGTCFAIASTPGGAGYWILNGDRGTIFRFGTAGSFGQPADSFAGVPREFVPAFLGIVSSPSGHGYWVLAAGSSGAGSVFHFGDAGFFGDTQHVAQSTHTAFNGSPVGLAATPNGGGYWEVHSDGGVFAFGNAKFFGSKGGAHLAHPIVGIARTNDGKGYWLAASDGSVFAFGDAVLAGSMAGRHLNQPVVAITADPHGAGYWLVAGDGGVFAFGGAPFLGSMSGRPLHRPIFGMTAVS